MITATNQGSPPQVRGKLKQSLYSAPACRITPAGAGKTYAFENFIQIVKDHPRRCGENNTAEHKKPAGTGSPPQVRGKRIA